MPSTYFKKSNFINLSADSGRATLGPRTDPGMGRLVVIATIKSQYSVKICKQMTPYIVQLLGTVVLVQVHYTDIFLLRKGGEFLRLSFLICYATFSIIRCNRGRTPPWEILRAMRSFDLLCLRRIALVCKLHIWMPIFCSTHRWLSFFSSVWSSPSYLTCLSSI